MLNNISPKYGYFVHVKPVIFFCQITQVHVVLVVAFELIEFLYPTQLCLEVNVRANQPLRNAEQKAEDASNCSNPIFYIID